MHGLPPIFWINLERSAQRRARMQARLDARDLLHERVVAVDGRDAARTHAVLRSAAKSTTEAACIASHLLLIREAYRRGLPSALVLEDDTTFEPFDSWPDAYTRLASALPTAAGALALTLGGEPRDLDALFRQREPVVRLGKHGYWSSGAYVIYRAGMHALLERYDRGDHFDITDFDDYQDAYKLIMRTLRDAPSLDGAYVSRIPLFLYEAQDSEIHPHHLPEHQRARAYMLEHYQALLAGSYRSPYTIAGRIEKLASLLRRS